MFIRVHASKAKVIRIPAYTDQVHLNKSLFHAALPTSIPLNNGGHKGEPLAAAGFCRRPAPPIPAVVTPRRARRAKPAGRRGRRQFSGQDAQQRDPEATPAGVQEVLYAYPQEHHEQAGV